MNPSVRPFDSTTLFCTAGMQQFKPLFIDPSVTATFANLQSCLRLGDLDEIGDGTHLLRFDMLGLFSFRQMTVGQAIDFWLGFLAEIGASPDHVTIHPDRTGRLVAAVSRPGADPARPGLHLERRQRHRPLHRVLPGRGRDREHRQPARHLHRCGVRAGSPGRPGQRHPADDPGGDPGRGIESIIASGYRPGREDAGLCPAQAAAPAVGDRRIARPPVLPGGGGAAAAAARPLRPARSRIIRTSRRNGGSTPMASIWTRSRGRRKPAPAAQTPQPRTEDVRRRPGPLGPGAGRRADRHPWQPVAGGALWRPAGHDQAAGE